jgi:nucleoporin NUP82
MPKVKSYAPGWLNPPAPAHSLFKPNTTHKRLGSSLLGGASRETKPGPRRTIARRGTEVFVAVGKEIRWGDLAYLKDAWEDKEAGRFGGSRIKREDSAFDFDVYDEEPDQQGAEEEARGYRVRVPSALSQRWVADTLLL